MKNFWIFVACWFLFQLVFVSAVINSRSASMVGLTHDQKQAQYVADCADANGFEGFLMGLAFPLTSTPFISGDFCWNN